MASTAARAWAKKGSRAEPLGNYNRILLSPVLAGEKTIGEIMLNDEKWYADNKITLHKGTAVTNIDIVHGGRVTYPLHNWTIELASGQAVAPDKGCVRRYSLRIEGGTMFLKPELG
jgi:nitrite reductase/ring-hydroxylating ferredoxin subunit